MLILYLTVTQQSINDKIFNISSSNPKVRALYLQRICQDSQLHRFTMWTESHAGPYHFSLELLQLLHENKIKTGPRGDLPS